MLVYITACIYIPSLAVSLCTRTHQVRQLVDHFNRTTGKDFNQTLEVTYSGDLRKLFLALARGARSDAPLRPGDDLALAQRLYKAGEGKIGTDEATFIEIFSSYGPGPLSQVSQQYLNQRGRNLITAVEKEFGKGMKRTLMGCLDRDAAYYGNLNGTMKGVGTNDMGLIWLLASRPRWEMKQITETYQRIMGKSLEKDIRGDTSGSFQKAMLTYIEPMP